MEAVEIEVIADPALAEPVLIEGLPGVGHVGKLAAEYLLEEFDAEPVRRLYSRHFPPVVTVDAEGVGRLAHATFYAVDLDGRDALALVGDYQAQDGVGHYRLVEAVLDVAESFDVGEALGLGGVPTGELVEDRAVLGAVSGPALRGPLEAAGTEFRADEPAGGIVGSTGLLLGLGRRRGLAVACLLGETSGYLVDPKSAQAVLAVLGDHLGVDVDFGGLEDRAAELEEVVRQLRAMTADEPGEAASEEDLRYFD